MLDRGFIGGARRQNPMQRTDILVVDVRHQVAADKVLRSDAEHLCADLSSLQDRPLEVDDEHQISR